MPEVRIVPQLRRFFPALAETPSVTVDGETVAEVVRALDARVPGLAGYVVDERGALRVHVNIFVGDAMVIDRRGLSDRVPAGVGVFIAQALSGG